MYAIRAIKAKLNSRERTQCERGNRVLKPKTTASPKRRIVFMCLGVFVAGTAILFSRDALDTGRVRVSSAEALSSYFQEIDYGPQALRSGQAKIPRLIISDIPTGWAEGLTVDRKKSLFFRSLLPMVLLANEEIRVDRSKLSELRKKLSRNTPNTKAERAWFAEISQRYRVTKASDDVSVPVTKEAIDALLLRVDVVPPSLALAQGAVESAYATSRFAVEGNALFGQWRFGDGLVPGEQRTQLGDYRIADFKTPLGSVRAYMRNLNSNRAYSAFRNQRAQMRTVQEPPRGAPLAAGLLSYSEKGEAYVSLIRSLIARNGLSETDGAKLRDMPTVRITTGPL